ncbi:MAG: metallophosphoesterase family protein [Candidatus Hodarchaeales archaeon]|jgi:predicted MPP superfamily phosphohydrolase
MKSNLLLFLPVFLLLIQTPNSAITVENDLESSTIQEISAFTPYKFIKISDTQESSTKDNSGPEAVYALVQTTIQEQDIDFILHSGDHVEFGAEQDDYDTYYWPLMTSINDSVPMYHAVGNHDYKGYSAENDEKDLNTYKANVDNPGNEIYYSFDSPQNDTHFIVLNSEYYFEDQNSTRQEAQLNWVISDLTSTTTERIVVMFHRGMYGANPGYAGDHPTIRDVWEEIFIDYGVDMVLVGHDHCFYHGNRYGIDHITSGVGATTIIRPIPGHPDLDWQDDDEYGEGNHISIFEATEIGFNVELVYVDGSTYNFSMIIPIVDELAPRLLATDNPVAYQETDGYNISWKFDDDHHDNYSIYLEDSLIQTGSWVSGRSISYSLDDLLAGTHQFAVKVEDSKGYSTFVNTSVEILPGAAPLTTSDLSTTQSSTTTTVNSTSSFQILLIFFSISCTIVIRKKR